VDAGKAAVACQAEQSSPYGWVKAHTVNPLTAVYAFNKADYQRIDECRFGIVIATCIFKVCLFERAMIPTARRGRLK
jgi:hypothetical protein